jgi:hypothetical protein
MALAAPSSCATPRAAYAFATHPPRAQVARPPILPIVPCEHTLAPGPELPDGPVPPLPQGLCDVLHLLAEPLGDRLAPDRQLARARLTASVRHAEKVAGLRFPLATPLAPCLCPTLTLTEARLVRVPCEGTPGAACPQVAQTLLGIVFVLAADTDI